MPYRAVAQAALERWRDAQRRLEAAIPDGEDWRQAYIDEELAKADYQQAIDDARREHLPEPPPFDTVTELTSIDAEGDDDQVFGG